MPDAPGELEPEGGASYTPGTPGGLVPEGGGAATPGDPGNLTPSTPASPVAPPSITPSTPPSVPSGTQWATQAEAEAGLSGDTLMSPLRTKQAIPKFAVARDEPEVILISVGDSIMSDIGYGFWLDDLIANNAEFKKATKVEMGVPGSAIFDLQSTLAASLAPYAVTTKQTRLIVFLGTGINDFGGSVTPAQLLSAMETCSTIIRAAGGICVAFNSPSRSSQLVKVAEYLPLLQASYEAGNFDFLFNLHDLEPDIEEGVHQSELGNEQMAKEQQNVLRGNPTPFGTSLSLPLKTTLSITGITAAASASVTAVGHGLTTGQYVHITGTNSTPVVDGIRMVTVTGTDTFTVPVTTSVIGSAGSVNKGVVRIGSRIDYRRQNTWILQSFNNNAGGANTEAFLGTYGFSAGGKYEFQLHSIAYFANGFGEASPIFFGSCLDNGDSTIDSFLVNKSTGFSYTIYPKLLANSIP